MSIGTPGVVPISLQLPHCRGCTYHKEIIGFLHRVAVQRLGQPLQAKMNLQDQTNIQHGKAQRLFFATQATMTRQSREVRMSVGVNRVKSRPCLLPFEYFFLQLESSKARHGVHTSSSKADMACSNSSSNLELGRGVLAARDLIVPVATILRDAGHLEHRVQPSMIEPVQAQDLQWEEAFSHNPSTSSRPIKVVVG